MKKVQLKEIGAGGLFIHRKQLWRSLGYLCEGSHTVTAERIQTIADHRHGEVYSTPAADYSDAMMVEPCGAEEYFDFI